MQRRTVFVIGAGASKKANLPTGHELKRSISDLLDIRFDSIGKLERGDALIIHALKTHVKEYDRTGSDINTYIKWARHIRDALPQAISIDTFIDTHRDNANIALCGNLAIVRSILKAEKNSLLYFKQDRLNSSINFNDLQTT